MGNAIVIVEIRTEATPGSNIYDCIGEAVMLAVREDVTVSVTHNAVSYRIDPDKIREFVGKENEK